MWKDFFYYSKSERRAIYVLVVLIALLLVAIVLVPKWRVPEVAALSSRDSLGLKIFESEVLLPKQKRAGNGWGKKEENAVQLFFFDPNLADSIELSRLGLSSFVVKNVLKYRDKGGRFSSPESFARIYGLSVEKFKELEPYIRISESFVRKSKPFKVKSVAPASPASEKKDTLRIFKYPEGTLVDVNLADTVELKKIPGIGSGISRAIVSYRNRLGGFYALEQLEEITYVTAELLKWFKLETVSIRKLPINRMSLDELRAHPYLNFYQAKVIVEHRRKRGEIKSLSQLSLYEEFTEKDLKRLSVYLSFD